MTVLLCPFIVLLKKRVKKQDEDGNSSEEVDELESETEDDDSETGYIPNITSSSKFQVSRMTSNLAVIEPN